MSGSAPSVVAGMVAAAASAEPLAFASVYAAEAPFVWRSLRRLGVRPGDVEDTCQEVFLIVHAKLGEFHGGSVRAWLFAIAARIAADYRKRAFVRHEEMGDMPDPAIPETQTATLERARAVALLDTFLAGLDEDKRAVFMLFELEQMPMQEVASAVGCPLQTAYTRLHAARELVQAAIERWRAKTGERS